MKKTLLLLALASASSWGAALVLQTDFGTQDGAVAAMKGVAFGVDGQLPIFDLTHDIPPYDLWQGGYRLFQTYRYWPAGTVFVSVIDPGVGTERRSIVARSKSGHYFVSPDNGTLTLIADNDGIAALRQIDETKNRLAGSEKSYTFHGRDVYAYTGARLAAGKIKFEEVGPELPVELVRIPYQRASLENGLIRGNIPVLDVQYGNVWTNIDEALLDAAGIKKNDWVCVEIRQGDRLKYVGTMPYKSSFGEVETGKPLLYLNSLLQVSFALNMENFAEKNQVQSGADWSATVKACPAEDSDSKPASHEGP